MTASINDIGALFVQLGLPSSEREVNEFVANHPVPHGMLVCEAPFWNTGQRRFLKDATEFDAKWAGPVDPLAVLLTDRS